jgi:integrase
MAKVRIKFRTPSDHCDLGVLFIQVFHARQLRQFTTDYRITPEEWRTYQEKGALFSTDPRRMPVLQKLQRELGADILVLDKAISALKQSKQEYTVSEIMRLYQATRSDVLFFRFMEKLIAEFKQDGKWRLAETYTSALCSMRAYCRNIDLPFEELTTKCFEDYEQYLLTKGLTLNTISFYMRNLRAAYNRAVDYGLTEQRMPFRHVYTGIEKTQKRALPLSDLRRIKTMNLSERPVLLFARDMFLLSFYLRGMSFVDLAYLSKTNLNKDVLIYRRSKTKQMLSVKWEPCMQQIVDRYKDEASPRLLSIIKDEKKARTCYLGASRRVNRALKIIGRTLGLPFELTMYVSRHSWASIAKNEGIPIAVISEGLGHDSEKTTRIYLDSLDNSKIDNANSQIINLL